jgi:hypothetical protein
MEGVESDPVLVVLLRDALIQSALAVTLPRRDLGAIDDQRSSDDPGI